MNPATQDGNPITANWLSGRPAKASMLFRHGMDTLQIAHNFAIKEATILRWITMERCQRLDRSSPYGLK